jgi:hypothetical protein
MPFLILTAILIAAFLASLRAFERASIQTLKSLFSWIAALAGISLALLLALTGRPIPGVLALLLLSPIIWERIRNAHTGFSEASFAAAPRPQRRPPPPQPRQPPPGQPPPRQRMPSDEAYEILGLPLNASTEEIRAAHRRLMRTAHPDRGGSDRLASRINAARDTLLAGRR